MRHGSVSKARLPNAIKNPSFLCAGGAAAAGRTEMPPARAGLRQGGTECSVRMSYGIPREIAMGRSFTMVRLDFCRVRRLYRWPSDCVGLCEAETGSREENASKQKFRASVLIRSKPERL